MIPNRIEAYCDLSGFAYLHECNGMIGLAPGGASWKVNGVEHFSPTNQPIVLAEELDGDGQIVRTWYVFSQSARDGAAIANHGRIVSRDIRPGVPTPDYNPNESVTIGQQICDNELVRIQHARNEMLATRDRHLIYAQSYLDALKNADGWRGDVQHLNSVVAEKDATIKERDNEIFELKDETTLNRLQIATLQASYAELENRKSLPERVKVWCRSTLKRLTKCASKQAE